MVPRDDEAESSENVTNSETDNGSKSSDPQGPQSGICVNAIEMSSDARSSNETQGESGNVLVNGETKHSGDEESVDDDNLGKAKTNKKRHERPADLKLHDAVAHTDGHMNGECNGQGEDSNQTNKHNSAAGDSTKDQDSGYGTLESGRGDCSNEHSGSDVTDSPSRPKLKKQASLLTPPVDATGAHPLLDADVAKEEDDTQMYDLYGVVVSTCTTRFLCSSVECNLNYDAQAPRYRPIWFRAQTLSLAITGGFRIC